MGIGEQFELEKTGRIDPEKPERKIVIGNETDQEVTYTVSAFGPRDFNQEGYDAGYAGAASTPPADVIEAGDDAVNDWNDGYTQAAFENGPDEIADDDDDWDGA